MKGSSFLRGRWTGRKSPPAYTPVSYSVGDVAVAAKIPFVAQIHGKINSAGDKLEIEHKGIRLPLTTSKSRGGSR